VMPNMQALGLSMTGAGAAVGGLFYFMRMNRRVVDDLVVNMIDVGEETGEMDAMLLKIADNYDEEVDVAVAALVSLLEPIMVVVLGVMVGTIVVAMFLPMIKMLESLSG